MSQIFYLSISTYGIALTVLYRVFSFSFYRLYSVRHIILYHIIHLHAVPCYVVLFMVRCLNVAQYVVLCPSLPSPPLHCDIFLEKWLTSNPFYSIPSYSIPLCILYDIRLPVFELSGGVHQISSSSPASSSYSSSTTSSPSISLSSSIHCVGLSSTSSIVHSLYPLQTGRVGISVTLPPTALSGLNGESLVSRNCHTICIPSSSTCCQCALYLYRFFMFYNVSFLTLKIYFIFCTCCTNFCT